MKLGDRVFFDRQFAGEFWLLGGVFKEDCVEFATGNVALNTSAVRFINHSDGDHINFRQDRGLSDDDPVYIICGGSLENYYCLLVEEHEIEVESNLDRVQRVSEGLVKRSAEEILVYLNEYTENIKWEVASTHVLHYWLQIHFRARIEPSLVYYATVEIDITEELPRQYSNGAYYCIESVTRDYKNRLYPKDKWLRYIH